MRVAEPVLAPWKADLALGFSCRNHKSLLTEKRSDGPLVVLKPLYPEGEGVCHAIVVHPPGGIAGGDELALRARSEAGAHALLTTPGAAKWYRTAGSWAKQQLLFDIEGVLEWLPRETIVFDGALAELECIINLGAGARFIGWEVVCLGRAGSGERFNRGQLKIKTRIERHQRPLWIERGAVEGNRRLMQSPAGLGGHTVFGTFVATCSNLVPEARKVVPDSIAVTQLPELLIARYLGDSSQEALRGFTALWSALRPAIAGRAALEPRIWST
jgi:urease accessory protein